MRTLLISLIALGLFTTSSCVNEGGQVFGELPEGVVPVSGEAWRLEVPSIIKI